MLCGPMKKLLSIFAATICFGAISQASQAQLIVAGSGPQQICYQKALLDNPGSKAAIKTCTEGLERALSRKDRAATYINRGILYMRKGDYVKARADYEEAIQTHSGLPEAYMNYGAVLIYMDDFDGAIKALNTAIEDLPPTQLHQALFNRAIAYDRQDKFREAYLDLKHALELRPDWDEAKNAISRYAVKSKSAG